MAVTKSEHGLSHSNESLAVTGTFYQETQPVSGTVTTNQGTSPWVISASSLPLPSGAATLAAQGQWRDTTGTLQNYKIADGKPRISATPYGYDVVEGGIANHTAWNKIGYNPDVQTAKETLTPQGGLYVFPSAAMQMTLVSSDNTQDKAGGTGALTVTLYYLTNTYAEATETITLNGTTKVNTQATNILRVNNLRVTTTGTNYAPVGNLSLQGAVDNIVYGYIRAGFTRQRQLVYTVPLGKTLYVTDTRVYGVHTASNKSAIVTLHATYDDKSGQVLTAGKFFMPFWEAQIVDAPVIVHYSFPRVFPATVDFMVTATSSGTASLSCGMGGWIE